MGWADNVVFAQYQSHDATAQESQRKSAQQIAEIMHTEIHAAITHRDGPKDQETHDAPTAKKIGHDKNQGPRVAGM